MALIRLGSDVVLHGALADRPAAGVKDRLFFKTDATATWQRDTGSAWEDITWENPALAPSLSAVGDQPRARLAYSNTSVPAGNTVANTVTETAFASTYTIPANWLDAGDAIEVDLFGVFGQDLVPATLRGKLKLGSTVMLDTGALSGFATVTNAGWRATARLIVTATGASGTIEAQGMASFATAVTTALAVHLTNTAAITIDTTAAQAITVTVQWGTADADNTISLRQMIVRHLKAAT